MEGGNERQINRTQPRDIASERALVGAVLIDADMTDRLLATVSPSDFYSRQLSSIYEAVCELHSEGIQADEVTLLGRLREKGIPEETVTAQMLTELVAAVPVSTNAAAYAKRVREKARLRAFIRAARTVEDMCYADERPFADISSLCQKTFDDVFAGRESEDDTPTSKIVLDVLDRVSRVSSLKPGEYTGAPCGFAEIDHSTSGFMEGDLILIAARPSMGKTSFALSIARNMAQKKHLRVCIFSLEMPNSQVMTKLLSMEGMVELSKLRNPSVNPLRDEDWQGLVQAADRIGKGSPKSGAEQFYVSPHGSNYILDDTSGLTAEQVAARAKRYKKEFGIDIVIIDYLQLIAESSTHSRDGRQVAVQHISRVLKETAKALQIPVIALSQLSRAPETRLDHHPILQDLRDSGSIEQDADIVMFLYRDEYYNPDTEKKNIVEVQIKKNRNGPLCDTELVWLPEYTKMADKAGAGGRIPTVRR